MFNLLYKPPRTATAYFFTDLPDGLVGDLGEAVQANLAWRVPAFSLYAQDTWHALRNFTITFGLRWELEPAPRATSGNVTVYNLPNVADLSSLSSAPRGAPFYPTQYTNLALRIGLAWQMLDRGERKTVLRAGTGVFYDTAQSEVENVNSVPSIGFQQSNLPLNAFSNGAPLNSVPSVPLGVVAAPGYTVPRTYEWNVTLEQSFGRQTFSAAYTGAIGRRLLGSVTGPLYLGSTVLRQIWRFRAPTSARLTMRCNCSSTAEPVNEFRLWFLTRGLIRSTTCPTRSVGRTSRWARPTFSTPTSAEKTLILTSVRASMAL